MFFDTTHRKEPVMKKHTLGVVVGRFQVPELHIGHRYLLEYAQESNERLLVVLGSGKGLPTPRNPLAFETRREMLQQSFARAVIAEVFDHPSNAVWSMNLDATIDALFPLHEVILYGSRDSFIPYYSGKYATKVVEEIPSPNGTSIREDCTRSPLTPDFRKGLIQAQMRRPPIPYPVVDIAIRRKETQEILLGQKAHDMGKWRFIGGFFDPTCDMSLEDAANREAYEETSGIEICVPRYIGSTRIDDWRYRNDTDCIMSSFFVADYIFGSPRPRDDIDALSWFPYEEVSKLLTPEHAPLGELLKRALTDLPKE